MSGWEAAGWILLTVLGLAGCALFAGLETGVYCLNRVRLQVLAHQGQPAARLLNRMMSPPNALIAALLIGTNIATNIATSATGILLAEKGFAEWQVIILDALIIAPLLMIFAETLPKDLFAVQADRLVYPFARLMQVVMVLFTVIGAIPAIERINRLTMRWLDREGRTADALVVHPRAHVGTLMKEGVGQGLLSDDQSRMFERVLSLSERRVSDEMVPWSQVVTVRTGDPPSVLWNLGRNTRYSRFPLLDEGGRVAGVVSLYDALQYGQPQCPPLRELAREALVLDHRMPLRAALARLQTGHVAMAVVVRENKPLGVVTVKDLVEPITGELVNW